MTQPIHRPAEAPTGTEGSGGRDGVAVRILMAALVLAACRFVDLGAWSLWLDEAYTLADSRHGESLANPVGYAVFGAFYGLFEGRPDEWVLRFPAAAFGFLCVPLTAWALRPFAGARVAAMAALVVALSPWHVYWSQNARFYTLAQMLGLAGGGWVFRGLIRQGALAVGGGLALLGTAALVHPSAALLGGAFLSVPWFLRRAGIWPTGEFPRAAWLVLGLSCVAAVLGGATWVLDVWRTWELRQGAGDPVHLVLSLGYLVSPVVALGVIFGLLAILRARDERVYVLLAIATASLSVAFAASFFLRVSAQYVFVLFPWIAALAALPFGASPTSEPLTVRLRLYLVFLVVPLALETCLYFGVRNGDRPRWREAYAYIFEHRQPTDLLLGMEAPVAEYYLDPRADDLRDWRTVVQLDRWRARLPGDWARYDRRTWFVVNYEQLQDWGAEERIEMERLLDEECTLEATFDVPWTPRDLDVFVYLRGGEQAQDQEGE